MLPNLKFSGSVKLYVKPKAKSRKLVIPQPLCVFSDLICLNRIPPKNIKPSSTLPISSGLKSLANNANYLP